MRLVGVFLETQEEHGRKMWVTLPPALLSRVFFSPQLSLLLFNLYSLKSKLLWGHIHMPCWSPTVYRAVSKTLPLRLPSLINDLGTTLGRICISPATTHCFPGLHHVLCIVSSVNLRNVLVHLRNSDSWFETQQHRFLCWAVSFFSHLPGKLVIPFPVPWLRLTALWQWL